MKEKVDKSDFKGTMDKSIGTMDKSIPSGYPKFPPELNSFQPDRFYRDAFTYSDSDYQRLVSLKTDSPLHDITRGFKYFEESNLENEAKMTGEEDTEEQKPRVDDALTQITDYHGANEDGEEDPLIDIFFYNLTYNKLYRKIITYIGRCYYYVIGDQSVYTSPYMYTYLYYYFFFTEYTLVHVSLYFPYVEWITNYLLFTDIDGVYFNFIDVVIGCYIPALFFFFFSQYYVYRYNFHGHPYFLAGFSTFFYFLLLIPVYYASGFSLFLFFSFSIGTFFLFFTFYLFDVSDNFSNSDELGRVHLNYFLTAPSRKNSSTLFLPRYYYKCNWSNSGCTGTKIKKKPFTRVPFVINVSSIRVASKRHRAFIYNRIVVRMQYKNFMFPKSIPLIGLTFPRDPVGYSLTGHKYYVKNYPDASYEPTGQVVEDPDPSYDRYQSEPVYAYGRDYMNYCMGTSNVGIFEFANKSELFNNYRLADKEEINPGFISSLPSVRIASELYPYYTLNIWLATLDTTFKEQEDPIFSFKNTKLNFSVVNVNKDVNTFLPENYIYPFVIKSLSAFFDYMDKRFDRLTNYKYHAFKYPKDITAAILELERINQILISKSNISVRFYINLALYLSRVAKSISDANKRSDSNAAMMSSYFTCWLLIIKLEYIYVILDSYDVSSDPESVRSRATKLCLRVIDKRFDYFKDIKTSHALLVLE